MSDVCYKTLLEYAVGEMHVILRIVEPDSTCAMLIKDTLKHIEMLRKDFIEPDELKEKGGITPP